MNRAAAKRMTEYNQRWKDFNMSIVESARKVTLLLDSNLFHSHLLLCYRYRTIFLVQWSEYSVALTWGRLQQQRFLFIFRDSRIASDSHYYQVLQTLDEILFANIDVSAAVLNTILTNLASHQSFQSRLRNEFAVRTAEGAVDIEKFLSKQDTLLNFTVMESMRLSPPFCK